MSEFYNLWEKVEESKIVREIVELMVIHDIKPDNILPYLTENNLSEDAGWWQGIKGALRNMTQGYNAGRYANLPEESRRLRERAREISAILQNWQKNLAPYDRSGRISQFSTNALAALQPLQDTRFDDRIANLVQRNYTSGNRYSQERLDRGTSLRDRLAAGSQSEVPQNTPTPQADNPFAAQSYDTLNVGSVPNQPQQAVESPEQKAARERREHQAKQKAWKAYQSSPNSYTT